MTDLAVSTERGRVLVGDLPVAELRVEKNGPSSRRRQRVARHSHRLPAAGEVVIGKFVGVDSSGLPLVDHPLNPSGGPVASRTTVPLGPDRVGRDVVLGFEGGDARLPIVLGVVWQANETATEDAPFETPARAEIDGEQVVVSAQKEIVLRCGEASVTLTRAGKILIRGAYVLSRSSGVNRIKGGSVQIN